MCRIAGIINPFVGQEQLQLYIQAMCSIQQHGGPDDEGFFTSVNENLVFGHRRLSLLDISSAGHQPMHLASLSIIYNGEVYNFEEIKANLKSLGHLFNSHSDTEVILHAYQEWGVGCFKRFNGMFAIAIYDDLLKKVILARDVAGIKPLYYYQENKQLVFASEVKAFAQCGISLEEDPNWQIYFLSFGFIPEPHTTYKKVKQLKPGHYLTFEIQTGKIQEEVFEELIFNPILKDRDSVLQLIKTELGGAVKRHLISDAPIGVFLSGGIDSSIISMLAAQNTQQLKTLSVSFNERNFDESVFQNIVQKKIKSQHTHYTVTEKDYLEALPQLKTAFDQPSNDAINSWFISRCAKQEGLKAVLSGIGGDELFGGYPSFNRMQSANSLRHLPLRIFKIADHFSDDRLKKLFFLNDDKTYADYLFLRGFYTPNTISKLLDATEGEIEFALRSLHYDSPKKTAHPKNYVSWLEQNIYMRSQLLKDTDYMSMQHGIEVRVPFLDKEFLKLVYQIDPKIKFSKTTPKKLLIDAFKDILPKEVWQRKKMGFTFPFQEWNKHHPEIDKITSHSNQQVAKLGQQFLKNKLHWSRCFALLQIEHFLPLKDALFLTLKTFSHTGGIEKVNRILMKAGTDIQSKHLIRFHAKSLYDQKPDEKYITSRRFEGFNGNLIPFIYASFFKGIKCDVVMFSHINLAVVGLLIKWIHPQTKLLLQAHGIEVWGNQSFIKKLFLKKADFILAVSEFTRNKLVDKHQIDPSKCIIFPNSLDPYFNVVANPNLTESLRLKYKVKQEEQVLITLTRLSSSEKYKGYDKVISALHQLHKKGKNFKYLILGKYDELEFERITKLIDALKLKNQVILCDFVEDDEISSYFELADVFIMPSQKEGFGIVFIEAMACGLPVIAGNVDGSVDALKNGTLGTLIDPNDENAIIDAIENFKLHPLSNNEELLKSQIQELFGYPSYRKKLEKLLLN